MSTHKQKGWISLYRGIFEHWLSPFNRRGNERRFTKLEAWLFILTSVNHAPAKVLIKGTLYEVERGESLRSLKSWARHFHWSKSKTYKFFLLLERDNMISINSDYITTRLKVCNYDSYQDLRNATETLNSPQPGSNPEATEPQPGTNNNDNNLIMNNNLNIKAEILESQEFFKELAKIKKRSAEKLRQDFESFFTLEYLERKEPFLSSDVKRHFRNQRTKKPAKNSKIEEPKTNRP